MKNRYVKSRKKRIIIILIIILIILLMMLGYYFFFDNKVYDVKFLLNGENEIVLDVGTDYKEEGVKVLVNDTDMSNNIKIDNQNIDINKLGEYKIKYYIILDKREYDYYRTIKVVDRTKPIITLKGKSKIEMLIGENYKEEGYAAIDNYDGDITSKVIVKKDIDNSVNGEYKITYEVSDSSGNSALLERIVIINKPKQVTKENTSENKEVKKEIVETNYSNTITKNSFTGSGIYIEGYKKDNDSTFKLKLLGDNVYTFDLESIGNNKYKGNIDFSDVVNGSYDVYIISNNEEKLVNKMDFVDRIVRAKVKDKLITFNYANDEVKAVISDFAYLYDVIIDPGHGGNDTGASNEYIYEKELNLMVSMYEKCRFEDHGFKVYMTRTNDTYGNGMGDNSLSRLHRRAYEMGYYGAVSKIVYSNHHNFINDSSYSGYEIILPGYLTSSQMSDEFSIMNKFNSIYSLKENHLRFYSTDYDTEKKYSKLNGNVYSFKDNYAVNRIPYKLFNVKSIIYEGIYLSNKDDYNFYYNENNWIKVSEAKIEVYVNSLGGNYNSNNDNCLNNLFT